MLNSLLKSSRFINKSYLLSINKTNLFSTSTSSNTNANTNTNILTDATSEIYIEYLKSSDNGIVYIHLNRPSTKNALGLNLMNKFHSILDNISNDNNVKIIILNSNVEKVFCAGADLKERATMTPVQVNTFVSSLRNGFTKLYNLPQPVIAAIDGAALGGGLELALSCDIRIAGKGSIFGLPETGLAIIPGAGGTQRLPRLIGTAKAKELIFTGRRVAPSEALTLGLVNEVVENGKEGALNMARLMLNNGPIALRMAKKAINLGIEGDVTSGMVVEDLCYAQVIPTQDRIEGLTAFKEKRKPVYKGL